MKATKIKMKSGCGTSNNLLEIDSIYLMECEQDGFYKKDKVYDYLVKSNKGIQVDIHPYPNLIPMTSPSPNYEKYVKSSPNSTSIDNLLSLPRE
ncbi:DUF3892 domain-containing protein [Clostridium estertheticum]|uniref:DUF3892 domain-containing protein n=1 Tax=Clostridium estertheticum subsp. estertheticum TaxID=1552 RepID=A0A1J0GE60_9CLOT|nr:DUF3892 domain-containing protein [Clostridium estertheticum]APC39644.1 hypothetical protein A7L45_05965 [Clostridium estertheticum subsp. estertheticum]MBZ9614321.1 DUF3892 domain-containing protein [Clostridium estertheticum subsp. laramiense]WAG74258.1 DUF3892 domain-containing protein [Clostridium estertheticum]